MKITTIVATTAIVASAATLAAVAWVVADTDRQPTASAPAASMFESSLPVESRLVALEQAVSDERLARQLLQEEVLFLTAELEELRPEQAARDAGPEREVRPDRRTDTSVEERRGQFARRNSPAGRAERLVAAGIAPGLADWIVQREEELQMEALQARYEAGQSGDPADFFREQMSSGDALRAELGDADYERYLEANRRPTSVGISSVIGSSPAQSAGLKPGDEIVRYAGKRVFSMTDINLASMDGQPGQNVVVDIMRDGALMQVVMPRGPLGITGGRSRR